MKIGTPKKVFLGDDRVGMTPSSAVQQQKIRA